MIFVDQTVLHDPPEKHGNCFRATVASILEVDIGSMPAFEMEEGPGEWWSSFQSWCKNEGFTPQTYREDPGSLCIAVGKSPRSDTNHCIVYQDGQMVHDPHPDKTGLDSEPFYYIVILEKRG